MTRSVNPYTDWMDIPDSACPPNHFALLGVRESEENEVKIKSAYYRRVAKISVFEYGSDASVCQEILQELAIAKDCLVDPSKRTAYLAELAARNTSSNQSTNQDTGVPNRGKPKRAIPNHTQRPSAASVASAALASQRNQPTGKSTKDPALLKAASLARSREVETTATRPMPRAKKPFEMISVVRTPAEILDELVAQRGLTPFQAQRFVEHESDSLIIGPYIIESEYPSGFWGDVYTASRISTGEIVSLRLLPPSMKVDVSQLRSIIRKTDRLEVASLQQAIDCGKHDERIYIASEFINGEDLGSLVERTGGLTAYQAIYCVDSLAKGLNKAFQKGLDHGEIRPGKVLANPKGELYLTDLVLSNAVVTAKQSGKPMDGLIRVLPQSHLEFAAPETFSNASREVMHGDMYSLGCLLHYMISGVPPFQRTESLELIFAHRESTIPSLLDLNPDFPKELDDCLQRLLAKDPKQRYSSYSELRKALQTAYRALPQLKVTPRELWQQVQWNTGLEAKPQPGIQRYRLGKVLSLSAAAVGLLAGSLALYAAFRSTDVVAEPVQPVPREAPKPQQPKTIFLQDSIDTEVPTMESDDFFQVQ